MYLIDALEIVTTKDLSTQAGEYCECHKCGIVDTFFERVKEGTPCPTCGAPSIGAASFFDLSVLVFIDLLQEAYNSLPPESKPDTEQLESVHAHSGSVLIVFCILRELLLVRFIASLMAVQKLPEPVRERLHADNDSHSKRLFKLFPALTGISWPEALKLLKEKTGYDWLETNEFIKKASDARNDFVHKGKFHKVDREIAKECVSNLFPLLELFVGLNNTYVHHAA